MRVIRSLQAVSERERGWVVALGNFDGVHLGHQAILAQCRRQAQLLGTQPAVVTFEPHPREYFQPSLKPLRLYRFRQKMKALQACEMQSALILRFNHEMAAKTADDFLALLTHTLGVRHIITGENFAFGQARQGNAELLAKAADHYGFGYTALPGVKDAGGRIISSSRVRASLAEGDMAQAAGLLGRAYAIEGHVMHGQARGRSIGFPTANIQPGSILLPRFGVYTCRTTLADGRLVSGVANLGVRPTIGATAPQLEMHLFDFNGDLYGRRLSVELLAFLREEQRFESLAALQAQIAQDCAAAAKLLHSATTF